MKKIFLTLLLILALVCVFSACDEGDGASSSSSQSSSSQSSTPEPEPTPSVGAWLESQTLTIDGYTLSATLPNADQTFSFFNDITVADEASYIVASDMGCSQVLHSKTVTLQPGENTFYILVTCGKDMRLYTVNLYRRPICTVSFETYGGTAVESQQIEEGECATLPTGTPTRASYTFDRWDFDFSKPIEGNITVNAVYIPVTYTATFKADGVTVGTVDFTVETESITPPAVPQRACTNDVGAWESYSLGAQDITVNATYTHSPATRNVSYFFYDENGQQVVAYTTRIGCCTYLTEPKATMLNSRMDGYVFVDFVVPDGYSSITEIKATSDLEIQINVRKLEVFTVSVAIPADYADFYAPKYPDATRDADGNLVISKHEVYEGKNFNTRQNLPETLMIDEHTYYDKDARKWTGFYFNYDWDGLENVTPVSANTTIFADINPVEGTIAYTATKPTIDGVRDTNIYGETGFPLIKSYISGQLANVTPNYDWQYLNATMYLCWDGEYIYVCVEAQDPSMNSTYDAAYAEYVSTNANPYRNDSVEVWHSFAQLRSGITYDPETNRYTSGATVCRNAGQYLFTKTCVDSLATKVYCGLRPSVYFLGVHDNPDNYAATRQVETEGGKGTYTVEFVIRARLEPTEEQKTLDNLDPEITQDPQGDPEKLVYLGDALQPGRLVFFGLQINDVKAISNLGTDSDGNPIKPGDATNDYIAFGTQSQGNGAGVAKVTVKDEKYAIVPGTKKGEFEGDGYQIRRLVLGGLAPTAK